EFEVKTGLRQGDALSPMLFNIALVSVVRGLYDMDVGFDEIKPLAELLTERSKPMELMVNEDKIKYMILPRKNYNQQNIAVNEMLFNRVNTFKYLGVELRVDGNNHTEIQQRINSANKCFETWTTTKTDEQKVAIFERKIFGPKKDRSTGLRE
ncbi:ribosome biogenesis protein TSR3 isoform X1, partial [Aphis craccivora]